MHILVMNCGSSSLNYKVFALTAAGELHILAAGKAQRVGVIGREPASIEHHLGGNTTHRETDLPNHRYAGELILDFLQTQGVVIDAVGHRIVNGGAVFTQATRWTPAAAAQFETLLPIAPLHNPNALSVIQACQQRLPDLPQYLCFDTAFHASLPEAAYRYPLPTALTDAAPHAYRRYGFHGLSYQYVLEAVAAFLERPAADLKLVACHLGTGGSSAAAIANGQCQDTSMGFTPLPGLMMSTRSGDLDPLLPLYLQRVFGLTAGEVETLLNKRSGLLGVSGISSDLRDVQAAATPGSAAELAADLYAYRVARQIGSYAALLGGLELLVFTDDLGIHNALLRAAICAYLGWAGVQLDLARSAAAQGNAINQVNVPGAPVTILALPTDEEGVIARQGFRLFGQLPVPSQEETR